MAQHNEVGQWGEQTAALHLMHQDYQILERNWRFRHLEIDIIAEYLGEIVFVEVKLRKNDSHAEAREYVTAAKQQRVTVAAQLWLGQNETELQPRFDVIEIYAPDGAKGKVKINHIENAF